MSKTDQLEWEARLRLPAALAAFGAALLALLGFLVTRSIYEDRPGVLAGPDGLLSINESPGVLIAGSAIGAVATLLLAFVFFYLFRATLQRTPTLPRWFVYLIIAGPPLYAVAQVVGALDQIDLAETFADRSYSFEDANPQDSPDLTQCPAIRGDLGDACADELAQDSRQSPNPVLIFLSLVGPILVAFLFVMLPLRARRAGLLSPFMSILGVLCGILLVLPVLPPVILQAFWLGAIGALFLGKWPGGRGPAWETGEADPWPSPAKRRGLAGPGDKDAAAEPDAARGEADVEPDGSVDGEPPPERPSSRKRKRKRS